MNINEDIEFILNKISMNNFNAYLVGGCVRDKIMNKTPHDYDICTNALPNEIINTFKDQQLLLHGMKHGTITLILNKTPYEITTYRIDGEYTDNRRPDTVKFTTNLEKDLERRDFTINAMAFDGKNIIDPFFGQKDIENRTIRCVGNPEKRFNEDALRILRALRFASVLNFEIEQNTKKAIFKLYKNLSFISMERINAEFSKILLGQNCKKILDEYKEIFFYIIPELRKMDGFNQHNKYHLYDVWHHTLTVIESTPPDLILRLTALFHDIGKPETYTEDENNQGHFYEHPEMSVKITEDILKRMRYSNEIKDTVLLLIKEHSLTFDLSKKFLKKCLNRIGENNTRLLLIFRKADIIGQKGYDSAINRLKKVDDTISLLDEILSEESCVKIKDLQINGNDLLKLGFKQNSSIGNTLKLLLEKVINEELNNTHEVLINYVKNNKEKLECLK